MTFRTIGISSIIIFLTVILVTAQDDPTPVPDPVEAGRSVYRSNGCTSCHGLEGEGTMLAPALAGTSTAIIRRQVRAPLGIMPNFPPDLISAEELDALVTYILTIETFDIVLFEGERLQPEIGEEVVMRHWMTLTALEVGDVEVAREQIERIMEVVESTHLQQMATILELLDDGEIHEAQHIIESMLADISDLDESEGVVHLRLLLSAIRAEDTDAAAHQLEHYATSDEHDEALLQTLETLYAEEAYNSMATLLDTLLDELSIDMDDRGDDHNSDEDLNHDSEAHHNHEDDTDHEAHSHD